MHNVHNKPCEIMHDEQFAAHEQAPPPLVDKTPLVHRTNTVVVVVAVSVEVIAAELDVLVTVEVDVVDVVCKADDDVDVVDDVLVRVVPTVVVEDATVELTVGESIVLVEAALHRRPTTAVPDATVPANPSQLT